MFSATILLSLPRLEPGKPSQRHRHLGLLSTLAGEVNRFVKGCLRLRPAIGSSPVDRHVQQDPGQDIGRGPASGELECPIDERLALSRFPKPEWCHGCPGKQGPVLLELVRAHEERDRVADPFGASITFAREDERHSFRHGSEALRALVGAGGGEGRDPVAHATHRRDVTEVEGGMNRVRKYRDCQRRIDCRGIFDYLEQDAPALYDVASARGYVAA